MPNTLIIIIAIVSAVVIGAGCFAIGLLMERVHQTVRTMQSQIADLQKQITDLVAQQAQQQPKRLTHSTIAGIEDALAVAIDIVMEGQAADEYRQARMRQLQSILQITRQGPDAYPIDRPAGKKPKKNGQCSTAPAVNSITFPGMDQDAHA
jgi:outer membrane murein-binding lipoprotein Lpp